MPNSEFTYEKPNEQLYLSTLIAYLESKREKYLSSLVKEAKCTIQPSSTYSRKRWNALSTTVYLQIPVEKLNSINEAVKGKLIGFCDEVMPKEIGFDVVNVEFSPLLITTKKQDEPHMNITSKSVVVDGQKTEAIWDVFICHASEDKEDIAGPLAEALAAQGLKVWYDEFTLTLGDSLSRSIDHGLANSRFGVVILSPAFFNKEWPKRELDGLTAKEISYGKTILPIWHNVDRDFVLRYSPVLADKFAVSTAKGLNKVVDEILRAVSKSAESPPSKDTASLPTVSSEQDKEMFAKQLEDLPAGIGILAKITSRGYWRITIRPSVFKQNRIDTLLECEMAVADCQVSLRGWNYPHYETIDSGTDYVWSQTDWEDNKEYWRFHQSGQFVNYFGCEEDWWKESERSSESAKRYNTGEALEIFCALFRLTEICEFAARLVAKGICDDWMTISVELHRMFGRKLLALHGSLDEDYACKIADLNYEKQFSSQDVVAKGPELAMEHALWILERFNWRDVRSSGTVAILRDEQKKLLERRL